VRRPLSAATTHTVYGDGRILQIDALLHPPPPSRSVPRRPDVARTHVALPTHLSAASTGRISQAKAALTTASHHVPLPGQARFLTLFPPIFFPMFLGMIGETIVATALPAIAASLGNIELIAWVVVAYMICLAITAPVYGRLGDAFGRRRMMVVALSITLVGSVACAASVSIEMLIAARVLQGIGGGGLISLAHALIGQSVHPRDRIRFHGYIAAIGFGASALGPVIGGLLTATFGWPSVFLFNLPIGLVAIALVFRLPPRTTPFEPFRFDLPGLVLFASFVWSLLVLVQEGRQPADMRFSLMAGLSAVVVVSLILLVAREKRASNPLFPPSLIRNPTIWRCDAMAACHGAYFVSVLTFTPLFLRVVHGRSVAEIGLLLLPITFAAGLGALITGQIVSRIGKSAIFPSVGLIVVCSMLAVLSFAADSMSSLTVSAYLGVVALFMGTVMGVVQATVQAEARTELLGTATAAISLSRALGGAVGTALAGTVLFAVMAANGIGISTELQAILQGGSDEIASLGAQADIRGGIAVAFRGVFLLIAVYAAIGCTLAWTLPRRTL
jgi:MFS family permease